MPDVSFVKFSREMFVSTRLGAVVCCALCTLISTSALADGKYQRTKDDKTIVWNQDPKPGDSATWTGDRDRDGYASGFGTLTWYTASAQSGGESIYARYFGNMIKGKLDGPVNGHSKGVTGHAVFAEGKRVSRWAAGPVPSWKVPRSVPVPPIPETIKPAETKVAPSTSASPVYAAASPARPLPDYNSLREQSNPPSEVPAEGPRSGDAEMNRLTTAASAQPKPKLEIDDSLRSLTGPPPSLRNPKTQPPRNAAANADSAALTEQEVVELADAEAQRRGYDLSQYQRPGTHFDPVDSTWSLLYEPKNVSTKAATGKHFAVAVDSKTKRTAIVPGR